MKPMETAGRAVAALLDGGVRHVVVAPGSRSAPLAYALAAAEADGRVRLHVRIDERDAGFTALGLALASGRPAAVVTTSGTAVGNLMPAVMEAHHSAVPLIVVSADRPGELRGTGANQTTRQAGLFGTAVRYDVDIQAGADPTSSVATGIAAAMGAGSSRLAGVRGPVQLNLAFRDPLAPVLEAGSAVKPGRKGGAGTSGHQTGQDESAAGAAGRNGVEQPNVSGEPGRAVEGRDGSDRVQLRTPATGHRTVVVAGAGAGAGAELFASLLKLPLFADPTSNARHGANAVGPYRLLLEHLGQDIERVVLFGRPTLSRQVAALLARTDVETVIYEPEPVAWYEAGLRRERPISTRDELADFAGTGPEGWLEIWQEAAHRAEAALDSVLAREPAVTGLQVARSLWADTTRRNARLVVGSSNPVRDLDVAARPAERSWAGVFANRGIAGIDGTVATATGIALAEPERETRLLLGDLTLLHDVGGLFLGSGEASPNLQIIVLNDAGGGIFSLLEHGQLGESEQYRDSVERLFGTPHTVEVSALAQAYGVRYRLAGTAVDLEGALAERIRGRSIIEVRTERADLRNLHQRIKDAVRTAMA